MIDFNSYIYSKAAAARILNRNSSAIAELHRKADHIVVVFNDGSWNQAINCSEFKRDFAKYRRQQGQQLHSAMIDPSDDSLWYVGQHQIKVNPDFLSCTCNDYRTQQRVGIKTPTCKHCYAVLHKLGCNSLAEFIEAREPSEATNQSDDSTHYSQSTSVAEKANCAQCPYSQKIPSLPKEGEQRYFCTLAYRESTEAEFCIAPDRTPQLINHAS